MTKEKQKQMNIAKILGVGIAVLFLSGIAKAAGAVNAFFYPIVPSPVLRNDDCGSGEFGASRGNRSHEGIDIVVTPGEPIYSPITGVVIDRMVYPYPSDKSYEGIEIKGTGEHQDYWVKIFYVKPIAGIKGKTVSAGDVIANAQDISQKYDCDMLAHAHLEVRLYNTDLIDPTALVFGYSIV